MRKNDLNPSALEERFWRRVDKCGPIPSHRPELGPCWVWTGGKSKNGYGAIFLLGKLEGTHRAAFYLAYGRMPDPCALHHCDNRACVKAVGDEFGPLHIFEGTKTDNNADKMSKGREARGDRHGSVTHPERVPRGVRSGARLHPGIHRGEKNGRAKLTWEDVADIRRLCDAKSATRTQLAIRFGVTANLIGMIVRGDAWI